MGKILGAIKKEYLVAGNKELVLQSLQALISNNADLKNGDAIYNGFEIISSETFYFNLFNKDPIYKVVLKVKEENLVAKVTAKISTSFRLELMNFLAPLMVIFAAIISWPSIFGPNKTGDITAITIMFFLILLSIFMSFSKAYRHKSMGLKDMDELMGCLELG